MSYTVTLSLDHGKAIAGIEKAIRRAILINGEPLDSRNAQSRTGDSCCVLVVTDRANPVAPIWRQSEYAFLRFVVHAGLAKVVSGCCVISCWIVRVNEHPVGKLMKPVMTPFRNLSLKVGNLGFKFATLAFDRMHFILRRRIFLKQLDGKVLDFDDPLLHSLLKTGELRFVSCGNSGLCKVEGGCKSSKCGAN
jgi:hypothetical protein